MRVLAAPVRHLIRGARVYDHDGDVHQPPVSDMLIGGGIIEQVAPAITAPDGVEVIDGRDKLVLPGFVNAHYHSQDSLAKGLFEDMHFDHWSIFANPNHFGQRSLKEVRLRTLIGAIENLRNGITTVQDMITLVPQEDEYLDCILSAYEEAGIRAVVSISTRDLAAQDIAPFLPPDMPDAIRQRFLGVDRTAQTELDFVLRQIKRRGLHPTPIQSWALGPAAPQRCSPELMEGMAALSREFDLPVLTHVYETRTQATAWASSDPKTSLLGLLARCGLMNGRLGIAHGVWLSQFDIDMLAEAGATVISNPVSNLALKSGVAPLRDLCRAGVNIAIGCDNYSCAQTQNVFVSMRMLCLLASVMDVASTPLDAAFALRAATLAGARVVGLGGKAGALKPGMAADFSIVDLGEPSFVPFNSAARQSVFAECGRAIDTVFVSGRPVVRGGRMTTLDEHAIAMEAAEIAPLIRAEADAIAGRNAELVKPILRAIQDVWNLKVGFNRHIGHSNDD